METTTATIKAYLTDVVEARVAKLAKRATKLGVEAPQVAFTNFREVPVRDSLGRKTKELELVCDATLTYEQIKLSGEWQLVASVERGELGNLVYSHLENDFSHLRQAKLTCDHCQVKRQRNKHFVLHSNEGEEKVVGSTCMKDFLGIDPSKAIQFWTLFKEVFADDEKAKNSKDSQWLSIKTLVAWTCREVELNGFTSRSQAYNSYDGTVSTSDCVGMNFSIQSNPQVKQETKELVKPTTKSLEQAEQVLKELAKSLEQVATHGVDKVSEWDFKIASFLSLGYVKGTKDFNMIVGATGSTLLNIQKKKEQAQEQPVDPEAAQKLLASHSGDRVDFQAKVITVREVENNFSYSGGTNLMYILKLGSKENPVKVRFFTSKDFGWNEGDLVGCSVKVKRVTSDPKWGVTVQANYPKSFL